MAKEWIDYRKASEIDWGTESENGKLTREQIQLGAI